MAHALQTMILVYVNAITITKSFFFFFAFVYFLFYFSLILETIEKSGGMLQPETENEQVIAVSDTETIRPISKKDAQEMITICLGMLSAIFSIYGHTLDQSNARIAKVIFLLLYNYDFLSLSLCFFTYLTGKIFPTILCVCNQ